MNVALILVLLSQTAEHRITIGSGIRARAQPNGSAAEVIRLPIGTILPVKEKSPKPETIGGKTDHWYRVELPKGKSGWIFGGFTKVVDPARATEAHLELWRERSKVEATPFAERADLAELLQHSAPNAKSKEEAAELDFAFWLATKWALAAIPYDNRTAFEPWIEKQGDRLVYSEPAGEWFMNAKLGWDMAEKHRGTALADEMAWEAGSTPLPGECEGYVPCYLSVMNWTEGRYLELYPAGKHAKEAVDKVTEFLKLDPASMKEVADDDKKQVREDLAKIRTTLGKVDGKLAAPAMKQLALLESYAR